MAASGKVRCLAVARPLNQANEVFDELQKGQDLRPDRFNSLAEASRCRRTPKRCRWKKFGPHLPGQNLTYRKLPEQAQNLWCR